MRKRGDQHKKCGNKEARQWPKRPKVPFCHRFSFGMGMVLLVPEAISSILKLGAMMVLIKAGFM